MLAGHLQSSSLVDPAEDVAPEGHDLQELWYLYLSAGHLQWPTLVDPAEDVEPGGHDMH